MLTKADDLTAFRDYVFKVTGRLPTDRELKEALYVAKAEGEATTTEPPKPKPPPKKPEATKPTATKPTSTASPKPPKAEAPKPKPVKPVDGKPAPTAQPPKPPKPQAAAQPPKPKPASPAGSTKEPPPAEQPKPKGPTNQLKPVGAKPPPQPKPEPQEPTAKPVDNAEPPKPQAVKPKPQPMSAEEAARALARTGATSGMGGDVEGLVKPFRESEAIPSFDRSHGPANRLTPVKTKPVEPQPTAAPTDRHEPETSTQEHTDREAPAAEPARPERRPGTKPNVKDTHNFIQSIIQGGSFSADDAHSLVSDILDHDDKDVRKLARMMGARVTGSKAELARGLADDVLAKANVAPPEFDDPWAVDLFGPDESGKDDEVDLLAGSDTSGEGEAPTAEGAPDPIPLDEDYQVPIDDDLTAVPVAEDASGKEEPLEVEPAPAEGSGALEIPFTKKGMLAEKKLAELLVANLGLKESDAADIANDMYFVVDDAATDGADAERIRAKANARLAAMLKEKLGKDVVVGGEGGGPAANTQEQPGGEETDDQTIAARQLGFNSVEEMEAALDSGKLKYSDYRKAVKNAELARYGLSRRWGDDNGLDLEERPELPDRKAGKGKKQPSDLELEKYEAELAGVEARNNSKRLAAVYGEAAKKLKDTLDGWSDGDTIINESMGELSGLSARKSEVERDIQELLKIRPKERSKEHKARYSELTREAEDLAESIEITRHEVKLNLRNKLKSIGRHEEIEVTPKGNISDRLKGSVDKGRQFVSDMFNLGNGKLRPLSVSTEYNGKPVDRASYQFDTLNLSENDDIGTAVHEMGHWIEDNYKGIHHACLAFLQARVGGEAPQDMKRFGMAGEYGRPDDFAKAFGGNMSMASYVGKDYGNNATEVLSMGLEQMYRDPITFMQNDPEYAKFILGVMSGHVGGGPAGAGKPKAAPDSSGKAMAPKGKQDDVRAERVIKDAYKGVTSKIDDATVQLLKENYVHTPDSQVINLVLRNLKGKADPEAADSPDWKGRKQLLPEQVKTIEALDRAIKESPGLPQDTTLYRKVTAGALGDVRPGQVITDYGFGSTSLSREYVESEGEGFTGGENDVLNITAPEGTKGLYVDFDRFGGEEQGDEHEFILPRGYQMKVTGVRKEDGRKVIDCELVMTGSGKPLAQAPQASISSSGVDLFGDFGGEPSNQTQPEEQLQPQERPKLGANRDSLPSDEEISKSKFEPFTGPLGASLHNGSIGKVKIGGKDYFYKGLVESTDPWGKPKKDYIGEEKLRNEVVASDIAGLIGVAAPKARNAKAAGQEYDDGVLTEWVDGEPIGLLGKGQNLTGKGWREYTSKLQPGEVDRSILMAYLLDMGDRHLGNYMASRDGRLVSIDMEQSFVSSDDDINDRVDDALDRISSCSLAAMNVTGDDEIITGGFQKLKNKSLLKFDRGIVKDIANKADRIIEYLRKNGMEKQAGDVEAKKELLIKLAESKDVSYADLATLHEERKNRPAAEERPAVKPQAEGEEPKRRKFGRGTVSMKPRRKSVYRTRE